LPGRRSTSARGVSRSQSFYFVIVLLSLLYFTLFASLYQKHKKISLYQKHKKISFLYSCYLVTLFLSHYEF